MNIKTVEQIPRLEPEEENVMQSIVCINYLKLDFWRILEGFILGLKGFLEITSWKLQMMDIPRTRVKKRNGNLLTTFP